MNFTELLLPKWRIIKDANMPIYRKFPVKKVRKNIMSKRKTEWLQNKFNKKFGLVDKKNIIISNDFIMGHPSVINGIEKAMHDAMSEQWDIERKGVFGI